MNRLKNYLIHEVEKSTNEYIEYLNKCYSQGINPCEFNTNDKYMEMTSAIKALDKFDGNRRKKCCF